MRTIHRVTEASFPRVRAFLEAHVETSLFLLSNIDSYGLQLGEGLHSGNVKCIEEDGAIAGVFCLTRRGGLVADTGGRGDLAADILEASREEGIAIKTVINEWTIAQALWSLICRDPTFRPTFTSKEVFFRLPLRAAKATAGPPAGITVRPLTPNDFEEWERVNRMFLAEEGMPVVATDEQRREHFRRQAGAGRAWGAFQGGRLCSTAALNAVHRTRGLVGAVFTEPEFRRRGLSRAVMSFLIAEGAPALGIDTLLLFTGEANARAQALYTSLGFESTGYFGLFFGEHVASSAPA